MLTRVKVSKMDKSMLTVENKQNKWLRKEKIALQYSVGLFDLVTRVWKENTKTESHQSLDVFKFIQKFHANSSNIQR